LEGGGITVPAFLWCLIVGLIIRNAVGVIGYIWATRCGWLGRC
jgi:sodium--glutamate symport carrier gltS